MGGACGGVYEVSASHDLRQGGLQCSRSVGGDWLVLRCEPSRKGETLSEPPVCLSPLAVFCATGQHPVTLSTSYRDVLQGSSSLLTGS